MPAKRNPNISHLCTDHTVKMYNVVRTIRTILLYKFDDGCKSFVHIGHGLICQPIYTNAMWSIPRPIINNTNFGIRENKVTDYMNNWGKKKNTIFRSKSKDLDELLSDKLQPGGKLITKFLWGIIHKINGIIKLDRHGLI